MINLGAQMKILKEGTKPEEWKLEIKCTGFGNSGGGCGAILEVVISDLVYYAGVSGDSWGSRDSAYSIKCISCGTCTDLKSEETPKKRSEYSLVRKAPAAWYHR